MFKPIGVAVLSCLSLASVQGELTYRIYPVGDPGGGEPSINALNNRGSVAGEMPVDGKSGAAVWNEGVATQIPLGPDQAEFANGVNDAGTVVGMIVQNDFTQHAWAWNGKSVTMLPGADAQANAINDRGEIAGYSNVNGLRQATIWIAGQPTVLDIPNAIQSTANAINNNGDVVGEYSDGTATRAFIDHDGKISALASGVGTFDEALAVNDEGEILGRSTDFATGRAHTVLWRDGAIQVVKSADNESPGPYAINDSGAMLGSSEAGPAVWNKGVPTDLKALLPANSGWELLGAESINNRGQIMGVGEFKDQVEGFIMTPSTVAIPLPSAVVIGGVTFPLALLATLMFRDRSRRCELGVWRE